MALICLTTAVDISRAEDSITDLVKSVSTTLEKLCLDSNMCNTEFLRLDNYCCDGGSCCNYLQFVFGQQEGAQWKNFVYTCERPRGINIIIAVSAIFVVLLLIGLVFSILRCLCCDCLRSCFCPKKHHDFGKW
jgi:hypothetical protein